MSHFSRPDDSDSEISFRNSEVGETRPQIIQDENDRAQTLPPIEEDRASTISHSSSVDQSVASFEGRRDTEIVDRGAIQEMSRITNTLAGAVNKLVEKLNDNPKPAHAQDSLDPKHGGVIHRTQNQVDQIHTVTIDYRRQSPQENRNRSNSLHGDGPPAYNQRRSHTQYDQQFNRAQSHVPHERYWSSPDRVNRYSPYNRGSGPVKMPAFTGKEDFATWITRFETIAKRYNWSQDDKLDNLLPRIEDQAAEFVFSQLPPHVLDDYRELVQEMHSRYRVVETARSFAVQFSRRSQKYGETVEEYAADLKRMYDKAHGYRDRICRDEDLVRRFLDGLTDEDVKFEVEFNKEPRNIDEAVLHAANMIQMRNTAEPEKRYRKGTRRTLAEPHSRQDEIDYYQFHKDQVTSRASRSTHKSGMDMGQRGGHLAYCRDQGSSVPGAGPELSYEQGYPTHGYAEPHGNGIYRVQGRDEGIKQGTQGKSHNNTVIAESDPVTGSENFLLQIMETQKSILDRIEHLERSRGPRRQARANGVNVECFNCHEQGHFARDCPKRRNSGRNGNSQGTGQLQQERQNMQPLNGMGPALATKGRSN